MRKKVMSMLLSVTLVFTAVDATAFAAEQGTKAAALEDGTAEVRETETLKGTEEMGDVEQTSDVTKKYGGDCPKTLVRR